MRRNAKFKTPAFKVRALFLLIILGVCSFFLWGCAVDTHVTKNRLVAPLANDIKTFNPPLVGDAYSAQVLSLTLVGMVSQHGVTAQAEPELAEKWEFQDGGKRILFTLRPGLKWSDGHPLTTDDVLFTFQDVIFNKQIPTGSRDVLRIGKDKQLPKLEKIDDLRVAFTLPEPFAPFLLSAGGSQILPKHILEKTIRETDASGQRPKFLETWNLRTPLDTLVANGPYVISEYRPSERIIFKRNPHYWRQGQPYIEQFVYQIVDSPDTALLRFRSRDLDVYNLRGEDFQLLKRFERQDRFKIYNGGPATGQAFMMFNLNKGTDPETKTPFVDPIKSKWFNNTSFRQAVSYAIDRESMVTNLYRGLGQPQNSPISIPSPFYLPPEKGLKTYPFNPEKAKELLLKAGFTYNVENRLQDAQGNLVRFTLMSPTGGRTQIGAQIKNNLDKIGITVDFTPIDFGSLVDKLDNSKQWDATILGFTGSVEPHGSVNLWSPSGDAHMFNKQPLSGDKLYPQLYPGQEVSDWEIKIEELMIKAAREIDGEKRKVIYAEFQQLVQEQLPLIHLAMPLSLAAVRDRVQGVQYSALGGTLWNIESLKLVD